MPKEGKTDFDLMMTHIEYIQRDVQEIKSDLRDNYSAEKMDKRYITRREFMVYKASAYAVIGLVINWIYDIIKGL